ncbi:hypothetical protein FPSE_01651 [Fusarium pseudograminearum CS3096]|uniref:Uncharacterized protein n=1 Tax=Fusarium pseudograminearum (strain CS3096) TaxID=1028729 RepID=K3W2T1_FUSPC|nr:hypothetical protein FPSE_01651 [Fusarium pseudograminearum CS3096]EKJ78190.1 hypothetical protein FPSE_01651 [Fusarium pseudograminearum CS3096]
MLLITEIVRVSVKRKSYQEHNNVLVLRVMFVHEPFAHIRRANMPLAG